MNIERLTGIEGAREAKGFTVVVDIVRAATVEAYAFGQGARTIIPVATIDEAFILRREHPEYLLMGETHGYKVKGFDFGNSPSEIAEVNLDGKTLVQRTSSGTPGLVNAVHARELIFGSFVTCSSIVNYIRNKNYKDISIVSLDTEDTIFANYLEDSLNGKKLDKEKVRKTLCSHSEMQRFFDPRQPEFPKEDIDYILDFDKFKFLCLVERSNSIPTARKVEI